MAQNIFAQGMDAFKSGYDTQQTMRQDRARTTAGQALAAGDRPAAAAAFGNAGLTDDVRQVQGDQMLADDRGYRDTQREQADREHKGEMLIKATEALGQVPQQERFQALQHPIFQQLLGPDEIAKLKPEDLTDEHLKMFVGAVQQQLELVKASDGSYSAVDKKTGRPVYQYQAPQRPQYKTVGEGQSLVEIPGQEGAAPAAAPQGGDWLSAVSQAAPDAQVTSGYRTPEHNAEVGGKPNSQHLAGRAVDLVPRPGETMAQLYARVNKLPGAKAINEGDHVHVQVEGGTQTQGGARVIAQGAPKPAKADAPPSGYRYAADGSLSFIPGGPADPATKTSAGLKPIPAKIQSGYADNAKGMTQIDQAIAEIRRNPKALGGTAVGYVRNKFGNDVSQRADPGGVTTRAALANIGSLLIHDRSGAAVTAAETPRLLPFIPQVTDTPDAAIKKLEGLKGQYRNANDQMEVQFGEESGYRPLGVSTSGRPAAPNAKVAGGATPPVAALKADHITTFANGQRWTLSGGKALRVQ